MCTYRMYNLCLAGKYAIMYFKLYLTKTNAFIPGKNIHLDMVLKLILKAFSIKSSQSFP